MSESKPLLFKEETLYLLDQRKLPHEEIYISCKTTEDVCLAITNMVVRGAPLIGFSGLFAFALGVRNSEVDLDDLSLRIKKSRPTAVNLAYELDELLIVLKNNNFTSPNLVFDFVVNYAFDKIDQSQKRHEKIANFAIEELKCIFGDRKLNLLTHCNTGYLACGSLGTALGIISQYYKLNGVEKVWVSETRPYWQGSRLTSFELKKESVPHEILVEGAVSYLCSLKKVDAIFVGADRIARNGDTANKIGTANLSIIASYYNIPFYVVAPVSSFDTSMMTGAEIEVEMRPSEEITKFKDQLISPESIKGFNPSFDISEARNITKIICEKGIIDPKIPNDLIRVLQK